MILLSTIDHLITLDACLKLSLCDLLLLLRNYTTVEKEVSEPFDLVLLGFLLKLFVSARVVTQDPREDGVLPEVVESSAAEFV